MKKKITLIAISLVLILTVSACGGSASRNAKKYDGWYNATTTGSQNFPQACGIIIQYPKVSLVYASTAIDPTRTHVGLMDFVDGEARLYFKTVVRSVDGSNRPSDKGSCTASLSDNGSLLTVNWDDGSAMTFNRSDKTKEFLDGLIRQNKDEYYLFCTITDEGEPDDYIEQITVKPKN